MSFAFVFQPRSAGSQPREFDASTVWKDLTDLGESLLARVPYVVLGIVIFLLFWLIGSVIRRIFLAAGAGARLDVTLADLFGRLASAVMIVLGLLTQLAEKASSGGSRRAARPALMACAPECSLCINRRPKLTRTFHRLISRSHTKCRLAGCQYCTAHLTRQSGHPHSNVIGEDLLSVRWRTDDPDLSDIDY